MLSWCARIGMRKEFHSAVPKGRSPLKEKDRRATNPSPRVWQSLLGRSPAAVTERNCASPEARDTPALPQNLLLVYQTCRASRCVAQCNFKGADTPQQRTCMPLPLQAAQLSTLRPIPAQRQTQLWCEKPPTDVAIPLPRNPHLSLPAPILAVRSPSKAFACSACAPPPFWAWGGMQACMQSADLQDCAEMVRL